MTLPDPTDIVSDVLWPLATERFGETISYALQDLVKGTEEDLRSFGLQIARNMTIAAVRRDAEWGRELRAQALGLLELNRIRVTNKRRELVLRILEALCRMAIQAGLAAASQALFKNGEPVLGYDLLDKLKKGEHHV